MRQATKKPRNCPDASRLLQLLAVRHSGDVFVPECKTGSTYLGDMFRMDAWAMAKSWSKMCCTGYEIKVSRSDFIRDDKWQAYLPFCNAFYFVCPSSDVIRTEEVPADAGLIVSSKNATNLYTKKKAPFRDIQIDADVFRYVLMWRAKITRENSLGENGRVAWWRDFVEGRAKDRDVGWKAGKRIGEVIRKQVDEVQCKQRELEDRLKKYAQIETILQSLGINPEHGIWMPSVEERLRALHQIIPEELDRVTKQTIAALETMLRAIERAKQTGQREDAEEAKGETDA